ncbi:hypothetical protein TIFTF001_007294 [Ficus carica]|uniref:Uncharacterized protein n=1 Tax=Ficus carica TaxID=3494 RepID=A0AA87ZJ76_FICCA|nr:hypothetical protein TIFTF001_007294 [Ficus carica]
MSSKSGNGSSGSQYSAKECVGVDWTRSNAESKTYQGGSQSYQYSVKSIFAPDQKQKSTKNKG